MFDFNAVAGYLAKGQSILLKVACRYLLSVINLNVCTYAIVKAQLLYMCMYICSYWWWVASVKFSK